MNPRAEAVTGGPVLGEPGQSLLSYRLVTINVDEVVKGQSGKQVTVAELASADGQPTTFNAATWTMPGDRVVFGLVPFADAGDTGSGPVYRATATSTRFFLAGAGDVVAGYLDQAEARPFVVAVADRSETELLEQLRAAAS